MRLKRLDPCSCWHASRSTSSCSSTWYTYEACTWPLCVHATTYTYPAHLGLGTRKRATKDKALDALLESWYIHNLHKVAFYSAQTSNVSHTLSKMDARHDCDNPTTWCSLHPYHMFWVSAPEVLPELLSLIIIWNCAGKCVQLLHAQHAIVQLHQWFLCN